MPPFSLFSAFRRQAVRARAGNILQLPVLGIGLLSTFIKPVIYDAARASWTSARARARALTRQHDGAGSLWNKLQTVPLPFAARKRRPFKGTALIASSAFE